MEENEESKETPNIEQLKDRSLYLHVKHPPIKNKSTANDFYITKRTNTVLLVKKVLEILKGKDKSKESLFVNIHGMGAAVDAAIKVSLQIEEEMGGKVVCSPTTSTVSLIDEYQPLLPHLPPVTQVRNNSAIHVKIYFPKK